MLRSRVALCVLGVAAIASMISPPARASSFDASGIATISYPENGAGVGQGIDMATGLSANGVCVSGQTKTMALHPGDPVPQAVSASLKSIRDASSFFSETDISAQAQAKYLAYPAEADFKTKFITTHSFSEAATNISVYVSVEQRYYEAPADRAPSEGGPSTAPDQNISRAVRLNEDAVALAKTDPLKFKKACGDGFVAVLISGGELVGTVTITDTTQANSNTSSLAAGVQAYGSSVSGTIDNIVKTATQGHTAVITFDQSGGSGVTTPTDEATMIQAVQQLPSKAAVAPFAFRVVVRDYATLANWPGGSSFSQPSKLDNLMAAYWKLRTLMTTAQDAENPQTDPSKPPHFVFGMDNYAAPDFATSIAKVKPVFDAITAAQRALTAQIEACVDHPEACPDPVVTPLDIYALAIRLPLPWAGTDSPADIAAQQPFVAFANRVTAFNQSRWSRLTWAAQHYGTDGNCYYRDHYVTQAFEAENYVTVMQAAIADGSAAIRQGPANYREDLINYYVVQPSQGACVERADSPYCIATPAINGLESKVPLKGFHLVTNFSGDNIDKLHRWGSCPNGDFALTMQWAVQPDP